MKMGKIIKKKSFLDKNVIICGGSKGIGKETAKLIVQAGGNVYLIARDNKALEKTVQECRELKIALNQKIDMINVDVTNQDILRMKLESLVEKYGPPDYLLNIVGYAKPQYVQQYSIADFEDIMRVNFFGQLIPTIILLPFFMEQKSGHIANVSSVSGYMGMMGYTSYTPTKFAIVGWTEAMRHELKPYNINFSILYPPDTQTPGFDKENQTKPPECAILSETGKLYSAEQVAKTFVIGLIKNKFHVHAGSSKWISVVKRLIPRIFYRIIDHDYKKAMKKVEIMQSNIKDGI